MQRDPWSNVVAAAGAIGAAAALVYVIGGASLSLRYEGFGLPGNLAATLTPREVLLAAGLRTLFLWALLGVALVLVLRAIPDAKVRALVGRVRRRWIVLTVAVPAIILLLSVRVWWPLGTYGAVLAITLATLYWEPRSPRRLLAYAVSVGLVAVAYEADRLSYLVEWTCVDLAQAQQKICGTLIGQKENGLYLGVPGAASARAELSRPPHLAFLPSSRIEEATAEKQLARVIAARAAARREPLYSRLWEIRVR